MARSKQTARKSTTAAKPFEHKQLKTKRTAEKKTTEKGDKVKTKKNKRRHRPGELALKEIRRYQATTTTLIRKLPFQRLVREITMALTPEQDFRIQPGALEALQVASES